MLRIRPGSGLVGAAGTRVYCFAGAGTIPMEAAVVNRAAPGDRVGMVSHGYFVIASPRSPARSAWAPICWVLLRASMLTQTRFERSFLRGDQPTPVCVTHVDASTGVLADCAMLAATVRSGAPDPVIVLDGVCATGSIDERMDAWDLDVLLTGARKALSVPPGLALLFVGTRARMFNLEPNLPNALQPGKRPRTPSARRSPSAMESHTWRSGRRVATPRISGRLSFFVAHADLGLNIQQAIDAPNFSIQPFPSSFYPHLTRSAGASHDRESSFVGGHRRTSGEGSPRRRCRAVDKGYVSSIARDAGRSLLLASANARGMQSHAVGR